MIIIKLVSYLLKGKEFDIKRLYLIRHAKSGWKKEDRSDIMRGLTKRGIHDLETMGSYMALRKIKPDLILSSCALMAQLTADLLANKTKYSDSTQYMEELYLTRPEMALNVLSTQEDRYESIFFINHNPTLTELVNIFMDDEFTKFPTLGIFALKLDIESWTEIIDTPNAEIDFFIFPKQFKYYMPKQIRTTLK